MRSAAFVVGLLVGYGALRLTCRRVHRVHGPWLNCFEQETFARLQFARMQFREEFRCGCRRGLRGLRSNRGVGGI